MESVSPFILSLSHLKRINLNSLLRLVLNLLHWSWLQFNHFDRLCVLKVIRQWLQLFWLILNNLFGGVGMLLRCDNRLLNWLLLHQRHVWLKLEQLLNRILLVVVNVRFCHWRLCCSQLFRLRLWLIESVCKVWLMSRVSLFLVVRLVVLMVLMRTFCMMRLPMPLRLFRHNPIGMIFFYSIQIILWFMVPLIVLPICIIVILITLKSL